jgi:WD40-like Beta Propeller Repeat
MTGHDDFDRTLAGWFEADALSPVPAGGLDRVLDVTRQRRPRPAWLASLGSDWVGEAPEGSPIAGARVLPRLGVRWSRALIVLLVFAALVGGAVLVGALLLRSSPLPTGRLGHLAYGLDGSIYVADWDGRNPVRIADGTLDPGGGGPAGCGSFWGEGPIWSPDGRHLAYRSAWDNSCLAATGEGKVYLSDPAGHVVASFPGTGWLVSWSPDSTRVATSVDLGKTFGIYGLDGVRKALLTVPLGYEVHGDYSPVWSPDGMSLLMPIASVAPPSPSEIWELPIDGGTPRRVPANDPRSRFRAEYSHDGARMAFTAYPDSESLVIANADGTELRVLAGARVDPNYGPGPGDEYSSPVVSPTGDRVAFIWSPAVYDQTSDPSLSVYELRVVDVASGTVTTLARESGAVPLGPIRFSPEGDRILFSKSDTNFVGTSLWSVHVDGSDPQLLVTGTGWGDWQWQPPGR